MSDPLFSMDYSDKAVQSLLGEVLRRTGDLRPAFEDIGEFGLFVQDTHFKTKVDSQGQPWKPLSLYTIRYKLAMGRIIEPLQSTGLMRSRFNYRITKNSVIVGNSDAKARKHQLGIDTPKREFIYFTPKDIEEVVNILNDHVAGNP